MQYTCPEKRVRGSISLRNRGAETSMSVIGPARPQTLIFVSMMLAAVALAGCGGSPFGTFTLAVVPANVSLVAGGTSQTLTLSAGSTNGFSQPVSITLSSLPSGVTASPATLSLTPGSLAQITFTASSSAQPGNATITLTGTAGSITQTASSTLNIAVPPPMTSAALSATFFDFGGNLVNNAVTQTVTQITNTGPDSLTLNPSISGDPSYSIVAAQSCGSSLAPSASCDMVISYDPAEASAPNDQTAVLDMGFGDVPSNTVQTVSLTGESATMPVGTVSPTDNPQVALYTMTLPFPGSMNINFGSTTSYGLTTWSKSSDADGEQVRIFVAGMLARSTYHMAATVKFDDGVTATDSDHTFTTGALPANLWINLQATTTPGMTPQPGVDLLNALGEVAISDLSGNILWAYAEPGTQATNIVDGVKMMPNGDLLMAIGPDSQNMLSPAPSGAFTEIREVNLAGDTVKEISISDLNQELANATCAECHVTLLTFHHDVLPLANGHWLVLANTPMNLSSTTTPALTNEPSQNVLGDVIVDLNQNLQPVWAWNEFNHLDPNRHPMSFPDWTHTNAILYSQDDGNLLVSIRHQNWIVKVDYENGTGNGNILWRLGEGGDFTLVNGVDPTDWQYAQHGPSYFSTNTTGVFTLGMFDNGDDRLFPASVTCGTAGEPPCLYSTVPVFQIDETGKTATLLFHQILPAADYSLWGGNAEQLANGDLEYDICAYQTVDSIATEETQETTPQTVWTLFSTGKNLYRAFRIPSFYPGVQW
jgi:arylsulfate sulfotransferase